MKFSVNKVCIHYIIKHVVYVWYVTVGFNGVSLGGGGN